MPEFNTLIDLAKTLPGRWRVETERTDEGELYAGLVAPRFDKRAFPVLIGGTQGCGVLAEDWRGNVIAHGVGIEAAFGAIREALRPA